MPRIVSDNSEGECAPVRKEKGILDHMVDCVKNIHLVYLDCDFNFVRVNQAYAETCGFKPEEMVGKNHFDLYPNKENEAIFKRVRDTGVPDRFCDKPFTFPDQPQRGGTYWDWTLEPIKNNAGKVIGLVFSLVETTERKKAEEALALAKKQLETMVNSISDGLLVLDHNWRYTFVSQRAAEIVGIPKEKMLGGSVWELFPYAVGTKFDTEYHRAVETGKTVHFEEYYPEPINQWLEVYCYPSEEGLTVFFHDVTQRKKAEEALKESEKTFVELIERAPFGIYVINSQFCISQMNKGSQNGAFRNVRPVIGRNFSEAMHILWPEPTASEIIAHFRHTLETGEPYYSPPFINPRHDIVIVESYEWEIQRMKLPDGQYGVICYYFDSTKLRETERGLSEAQAKLKEYAANLESLVEERTNQLKNSERLAAIGATAGMVGHDIRNPLQAITSDIYLAKSELASTLESEEKKNALESLTEVEKNIEYINKIVADLQDFARPLSPVARGTSLENLIHEILLKSSIPKYISTSFEVEEEAKQVMADPDLLKRIISNLVLNAVQAMPRGGKLSIHAYRKEGGLVIEVQDTGEGIAEEVKTKLFTPMFTTKSKGQGFGLAVVKRVTEAMNGTVNFESEHGKGTKFIIRLPPPQRAKR